MQKREFIMRNTTVELLSGESVFISALSQAEKRFYQVTRIKKVKKSVDKTQTERDNDMLNVLVSKFY
jgi:hypothetical protein